jgi:predicted  nucleic acid-binding Zn-ribbon protein
MSIKESYEKKMQAQLDEWNAEIDKLKARAGKVQADMRAQYEREVEQLRGREQEARAKLEGLKAARESAWEAMKADVDQAREGLFTAIESAGNRFKLGEANEGNNEAHERRD